MLDKAFIENISARAAALFPAADTARQKLEAQIFNLLQGSLGHLNLVTREEFDAQIAILEKANNRITRLEQQLEALKAQADNAEQGSAD